jgi:hypothetical protein
MHEELSRYSLEPSGYSGRILGWSAEAGDAPCQTFAVYRDGVWKTRGLFVTRARGRADDPDDVLNGFCLRILGRLIDLASLSGGAGRRWTDEPYALRDLLEGAGGPRRHCAGRDNLSQLSQPHPDDRLTAESESRRLERAES